MNKLIEQLLPKPFRAQGAQISYDGNDKAFCHLYSITQMVEFAELIIKECALQCHHNDDMDRIFEHFGVKE